MAEADSTRSSNVIPFPGARAPHAEEPEQKVWIGMQIGEWQGSGLGDTIRNGDIVEVDCTVDAVRYDGVYLVDLWDDGALELRRVQILHGGARLADGTRPGGELLVWVDGFPKDRIARDALRVVGVVTRYWRRA